MRIRHLLAQSSCRSEHEGSYSFFLRNQTGWLSWYDTRQTRYEGWYIAIPDGSLPNVFMKILERLTYIADNGSTPAVRGMTVTEDSTFWEYGDGTRLGFRLANGENGLTITTLRPVSLRLTLDTRPMYHFPELGRSYTVHAGEGGTLIKYTGPNHGPVYMHIRSEGFDPDETWEQVPYPRDEQRHSPPATRYVFNAGTVRGSRISFGCGFSPEDAERASAAAHSLDLPVLGIGITHISHSLHKQVEIAQTRAEIALSHLQSATGLYAGLPWFHQVWSRDELIGALGLPSTQQHEIIVRYLDLPLEGGELPTFIGSGTTCADGVGWLALLIREYGLQNLSEPERERARTFFAMAEERLRTQRAAAHGLIASGHNTTWMDTIGRTGYRIEIQCMYALALELLFELTQDPYYERQRFAVLGNIKQLFYRNHYLWDGLGDPSKRPNVFLAYLLQPDLLNESCWHRCFRIVLNATQLEWGGLSSLDREHPSYQPESTGENNLSYHNGDSWFFINNLAALALHRFGHREFKPVVLELLRGSTEEILWKNILGQPGEIASAKDGTSWGCGIQAFSAGTYLALLAELGDYWVVQLRDSID